jgi:hypothetical protein
MSKRSENGFTVGFFRCDCSFSIYTAEDISEENLSLKTSVGMSS